MSGNDTNFASPNQFVTVPGSQNNSLLSAGGSVTQSSQLSDTVISSASSTSNTQLDNLSANSSYSATGGSGSGSGSGGGGGLLAAAVPNNNERSNVERSASFIGTKCKKN